MLLDNQNFLAFLAKSTPANPNKSYNSSNATSNQTKKYSNNRERPYCSHCKFQGHTIEKCYKLHEYPPSYKTKSKSNHVNVAIMNDDLNSSVSDELSNMLSGFFSSIMSTRCMPYQIT